MIKDFGVFTEETQLCAKGAYELALHHRHSTIEESHLLLAILECPNNLLRALFDYLSLDVERLKHETFLVMKLQRKVAFWKRRNYQFFNTLTVKRAIEDSVSLSRKMGEEKVTPVHFFWGVVNSSLELSENQSRMAQIFRDNGITAERVLKAIEAVSGER